jgi:plastocyanin
MRRVGTAAALFVTIAAVVSACGSSDSDSGGSGGSGSGGSGAPSVSMRGLKFAPARLEVKAGQKVTWTNDEDIDHNVTAKSGAKFMSKAFGKGQTYSFTPSKPGTIQYVCTLHPGMDGTLVVK